MVVVVVVVGHQHQRLLGWLWLWLPLWLVLWLLVVWLVVVVVVWLECPTRRMECCCHCVST